MITFEGWITITVVTAMFAMMATGRGTASAILAAVIALLLAGVIDEKQALSGFSNPAPVTVAALYVIARAIERTGVLNPLVSRAILGRSGPGQLFRLLAPAAGASALLNNSPIVAMLTPTVTRLAETHSIPISRLLMPLSFAVILGGLVTSIGTSTTVVVSGLLQSVGDRPLGIFEVTHVGLPIAMLGLITVSTLAPRLLPDRDPPRRKLREAERDFMFRMTVESGGPLDGLSVEAAGLRHLDDVFLVEIERGVESIAPVSPDLPVYGGDALIFTGSSGEAANLRSIRGLVSAEQPHLEDLGTADTDLIEVVVGSGSPLLGKTPKEIGFRGHYDAAIVGIHREGHPVSAQLGRVQLRLGDTLLLLARRDFAERWRDAPDFLLIATGEVENGMTQGRRALAVLVASGVVIFAAGGFASIFQAAVAGAALLVVTRVLSFQETCAAIDFEVVVVIAGAFGVGAAIEASGLGASIGTAIVDSTFGWGWRWPLLGIVLATMALTEFISNNAAAALMFPIALAVAAQLGADPRTFAIAVAMAASCSFLTPIGYQTNTMVYGPGGYRFGDYWRLGAPLTLVAIATIIGFA